MESLRKAIEEVRKRTDMRMVVDRVDRSLKSKLSRTIDMESSVSSSVTKQEINIVREQIKDLRDSQDSQLRHQEELS